MSAVYRPDWSALLNRLRARSQQPLAHIGRRCGMCEPTINRLARGEIHEPRFGPGLRLLDLAVDYLTPEEWSRVRQASGRSFIHGG